MVNEKNQKKIALFSVLPHKELESFGRALTKAGWKIIATNKACDFLKEKKIEVMDISDFTDVREDYGFPPTLHPKMEAALTTDFAEKIEIVYDIPYGIEIGDDVGGRTLLALAVKGKRIPIMNPEDMNIVVDSIAKKGKVDKKFADYLRNKASYEISKHYINLTLLTNKNNFYGLLGTKYRILKNGENPYQMPAILFDSKSKDLLSICNFKQVAGHVPCFTNTADLDSILETMCKLRSALVLNDIPKSFIVVAAKHGNPCGVGVSLKKPEEAINAALWGNVRAVWGGEVITNFPIDASLAEALKSSEKRKQIIGAAPWMLDIIAAPAIDDSAIRILSSNQNRKLFVNNALSFLSLKKDKYVIRPVRGGFICQPPPNYVLDLRKVEWTNNPSENKELFIEISLIIAWATASTSNHGGNEVAIAKNGALLSVGGGPSTIDAANTAIARAKEQNHDVKNSVFGADAFFPFTDVPKILFKAGCVGGTVPRGGKKEKYIIEYFRKNKMYVGMIPEQYRGFCRH